LATRDVDDEAQWGDYDGELAAIGSPGGPTVFETLAPPILPPASWPADAARLLTGNEADAGLDWTRVLFLDTETTGIGRDMNTYAFLVGLGWWERAEPEQAAPAQEQGAACGPAGDPDAAPAAPLPLARFHLRQHLIEAPYHESAMLAEIAATLERFDAVCTYNGRSFDVPMLAHRTQLQLRAALPPTAGRHLDLLAAGRRLYRDYAGGASLKLLEQALFERRRDRDVSGRLIPSVFLDYVHGRHRRRMIPVLRHNAQDVASLSDLLGELLDFLAAPRPGGAGARGAASTFRGLGKLHQARRNDDQRVEALEHALGLARGIDEERRCRCELAAALKKAGRFDDAAALWRVLTTEASVVAVEACLELAMHEERRAKNLAAAHDWARRADLLVDRLEEWESLRAYGREETRPAPDRMIADGGDDANLPADAELTITERRPRPGPDDVTPARLARWRDDLARRLPRLEARLRRAPAKDA
jgi:uncharacterized protein YprB with RNaseH-like and TPR domain